MWSPVASMTFCSSAHVTSWCQQHLITSQTTCDHWVWQHRPASVDTPQSGMCVMDALEGLHIGLTTWGWEDFSQWLLEVNNKHFSPIKAIKLADRMTGTWNWVTSNLSIVDFYHVWYFSLFWFSRNLLTGQIHRVTKTWFILLRRGNSVATVQHFHRC